MTKKFKTILFAMLIAMFLHEAYTQESELIDSLVLIEPDTMGLNIDILADTTEFEVSFDGNADSLLQIYYISSSVQNAPDQNFGSESEIIPAFSDAVYKSRLESLPMIVPMYYNDLVKRYIEVYTVKKRRQVEVMLGLSEHYFPVFDDIFDYYNVPNEMKYMSIIESALNPKAYSSARAVGLWQFMYGTGRIYGLEINSLVDERMDIYKSTEAAAKFIGDLHEMYGDWLLALAAYNCGPGNVNKAIRRSGGKKNFWEIYYYLPRETRGHVPAFIAAIYTMNYHKEHNLHAVEIEIPLTTDTILVNKKLHLQQVADVLDLPIQNLRDLNPQYRYDIIPGQIKPYTLRLPVDNVLSYIDFEDSIYTYKDSVYLNPKLTQQPTLSTTAPEAPGSDYEKLYYTVKSGDAVGLIAEWYDVRTSDLCYWNNIRKNSIRADQKLVIYKQKSIAHRYQDINSLTYAQKQTRSGKVVASTPATKSAATTATGTANTAASDKDEYVIYTVRQGDTLWDIAKKYPGVSDTDIMRWNNLTSANKISPGQKLKIKSKS